MRDNVRHDEAQRRFVLDVDGQEAYVAYRPIDDETVNYTYTWVPPAHRGGGIGREIVRAALAEARERGWKVVAGCGYVGAVARRDGGWDDVMA